MVSSCSNRFYVADVNADVSANKILNDKAESHKSSQKESCKQIKAGKPEKKDKQEVQLR